MERFDPEGGRQLGLEEKCAKDVIHCVEKALSFSVLW
jgi:hypothetical protein